MRFLKRCRDLGVSLGDAKALLDLSEGGAADCAEVIALAQRHMESVRRKIAELQRLQAALDELTANCAEGSVDCRMLGQLRMA